MVAVEGEGARAGEVNGAEGTVGDFDAAGLVPLEVAGLEIDGEESVAEVDGEAVGQPPG